MLQQFVRECDDRYLRFLNVTYLLFSAEGKLQIVRPHDEEFWGWSSSNSGQFELQTHFLSINNISPYTFSERLTAAFSGPENYLWKSPEGEVSPPIPTIWEHGENISEDGYAALLKPALLPAGPWHGGFRRQQLQSDAIPGFLHNLSGPLGTLIGRMELLQFKQPGLEGLDKIVQAACQLQKVLENFGFRVMHENHPEPVLINLNRFLRETIRGMANDLFFKHQVRTEFDLHPGVPEFHAPFMGLSGVFMECWGFASSFTNKQKEYHLIASTFVQTASAGFEITVGGHFREASLTTRLPLRLEGTSADVMDIELAELDSRFLAQCMDLLEGRITFIVRHDQLRFRYVFPVPA